MPRPDLSRVPESFHGYISQVPEDDLMESFRSSTPLMIQFFNDIPENKRDYKYGEDKWTIKEVLQHIIDTERVFNYRSLCFARKDPSPLPGFDENIFAANARAERRNWEQMMEEFIAVRQSSQYLYSSFDEEQLDTTGISNSRPNYPLGLGFATVGHGLHHIRIIRERYL